MQLSHLRVSTALVLAALIAGPVTTPVFASEKDDFWTRAERTVKKYGKRAYHDLNNSEHPVNYGIKLGQKSRCQLIKFDAGTRGGVHTYWECKD